MRLQKQKQTLYKLTKQKLGDCTWNGTRLESYEALDEERRQNVEQLSGFSKKTSSRNQFGISSVASGCQRNGQLHSSDLLQARLPGSLQVGLEIRDWRKTSLVGGRATLLQRRLSS